MSTYPTSNVALRTNSNPTPLIFSAAAALALALTTSLPPYITATLVVPIAAAGPITVALANGGTFVVPAGSTGAFRVPGGSTGTRTSVRLASAADGSIGASVVIQTWDRYAPPAQPQPEPGGDLTYDPWDGLTPLSGVAVFLSQQTGTLTGSAILSGYIALMGTLPGALTISSPSGFNQVIAGGTTAGLVALTGPTGRGATWSFANSSDAYAFDVFLVATLA
jgi:hypothetical protein